MNSIARKGRFGVITGVKKRGCRQDRSRGETVSTRAEAVLWVLRTRVSQQCSIAVPSALSAVVESVENELEKTEERNCRRGLIY